MKISALAVAALAWIVAGAASAEVSSRSENGFALSFERPVAAEADAILAAIGTPQAWWSDAHTYSGKAANLRLDLTPGGCWCETLPGGGVKHAETLMVWPDQGMARFDAPFGPLQGAGASAVLTVSWAEASGGERTLKGSFLVDGPGAGAMADAVDGVLGEQFDRLVRHLESD